MNRIATAVIGLTLACVCVRPCLAQQEPTAQNMVDPNRVVLVINGEEIKGAEYYRRMEYLPGVGSQMGASFSDFPPGFLTIQQLINSNSKHLGLR